MSVLKVGDTVTWRGSWGSDRPKKAKVESIEVDCDGKYGDEVDELAWSKVKNRDVVINLDNGHWAYGTQISK